MTAEGRGDSVGATTGVQPDSSDDTPLDTSHTADCNSARQMTAHSAARAREQRERDERGGEGGREAMEMEADVGCFPPSSKW